MNNRFKYYIWFHFQFIIDQFIQLCLSKDVKPFESVHHTAFICYIKSFHDVINWVNRVSVIKEMRSEFRFSVNIFEAV
jgi:hypothetical protein